MKINMTPRRLWMLAVMTASIAAGCGKGIPTSPVEENGFPLATISLAMGQKLDITMQTVGNGEFVSPPILDGSTLAFLDVTSGGNVPAGARQIFHFEGIATGRTIIRFQNTNSPGSESSDTVVVR